MKERYEMIKCGDIKIDLTYQREPNMKRVSKIAKSWDGLLARECVVSRREDGSSYCIDGNHTRLAKMNVFGEDATIKCKVLEGLNLSEEAELFYKMNTNASKPSFNEMLKAKSESGDPEAFDYVACLEECGIKYTFKKSGEGIIGHSGMLRAYRKYGRQNFTDGLELAKQIWDGDYEYYRADTFPALVAFVATYKHFDRKGFVASLKRKTLDEILRHSRVYATSSAGSQLHKYVAMAYVDIYNKGRRQKNWLDRTLITIGK